MQRRKTPTEKLEDLIMDCGYSVPVKNAITTAKGYWARQDVMRWEATVYDGLGKKRHIGCWSTISECVRCGVEIDKGRSDGCDDLEAVPKQPIKK